MHIAWIGKKTPFCGNVTYSREVTNALLDREHQVSFLHFAQEESDRITGQNAQKFTPFFFTSPRSTQFLH